MAATARVPTSRWLDRARRTTADEPGSVATATATCAYSKAIHSRSKAQRGPRDRLDDYRHRRVSDGWLFRPDSGNRGPRARLRRLAANQKVAGEIWWKAVCNRRRDYRRSQPSVLPGDLALVCSEGRPLVNSLAVV